MVKYEIRQVLKFLDREFISIVYESESYRFARLNFIYLQKKYPDDYFELFAIETKETCLDWTIEKERIKRVSQTT